MQQPIPSHMPQALPGHMPQPMPGYKPHTMPDMRVDCAQVPMIGVPTATAVPGYYP